MEGDDVRDPPARGGHHGQRRDERVVGLNVHEVPRAPGELAIQPRREVVVAPRGHCAKAPYHESLTRLDPRKPPGEVGTEHCETAVWCQAPRHFLHVSLDTPEVWREPRRD